MGLFSSKSDIRKMKETGDVPGLKAALEHKDKNVRASALEALESIDTDEIREILKAYFAKDREAARALTEKGTTLFKEWALKDARACFDKALEHDPAYADAWYWKSCLVYMDKNNEKESLNLVEKALALDSKHIRAWIHKAGLLGPKEYNEKLACYDRVLEMEPENTDSPLWKAVTLYELGRHVEAFDACEKAIDIEPENPQLWFTLALILENAGRKRESISAYERFVEMAEPGFSRPANNEANRNALSLLKTQVEIVKINEMGEQPADMSVMLALLRSYYMFFNICRNELPHDNNDESE